MLAGRIYGLHDYRLGEAEMPKIEKPTDALVKVTATAICTSEIHYAEGYQPLTAPFTTGHEFVGTIIEIGDEVKKFKVGDHVNVATYPFCGECPVCKSGNTGHCPNGALFGSDPAWGNLNGAMAEYVRVPFADTSCVIVPENVKDEEALLVADMMGTGYQGVTQAEVKEGDIVVVSGLGPVGLCAVALAKMRNPKMVIGIGRREERLKAAIECGADYVIDSDIGNDAIYEKVKEITGGDPLYAGSMIFEGFADSYIDTCGVASSSDLGLRLLKVGGRLSQVSMVNPDNYVFNMHTVCMKNITVQGGLTNLNDMQYLMDVLAEGKINVAPIITRVFPLSEFDKALDIFAHKKDGSIKVVLKP
ncbi:MAG: alcohol dehydrogenase catalytic domain-containing protein [Oscillospiraceae bacterium]|nr:alcohol dehydrogenase catalytic domain-containing protein [Oscillospiraceae bacterium]